MPEDHAPTAPVSFPDAAKIEAWLTSYIANILGARAETIDVRRPFTYFGLSSADSVILAGDLERWLGGVTLAPTLAWDYPTIEMLSRYLESIGPGEKQEVSNAGDHADAELEAILSEIEQLPEEPGTGIAGRPIDKSQTGGDE